MRKLWQEHSILIACFGLSIVLFAAFALLQAIGSNIMNLSTRWLVVAGIPLLVALLAGGYIATFRGFGVELESKLNRPVRSLTLKVTDAMTTVPGDEKASTVRLPDFTRSWIDR